MSKQDNPVGENPTRVIGCSLRRKVYSCSREGSAEAMFFQIIKP